MKKYLFSIVIIILLTYTAIAFGGDINSFFTLHPTTSNTHSATYKDKDYTYYQGGRTRIYNEPTQTIQPISITPPSISAGCSGIDIQYGGFNLANTQQYASFIKSTLKTAPYLATQMAIKALSSETADTIAEFQAIIDRLNAMQLDSCSAAQGLVTATVDLATDHEAAIAAAREKANNIASGTKDAFTNLGNAIKSDVSRIFNGYDNDIKSYDSLLLKINRRVPFPHSYDINEIRGMLGDMAIGAKDNNNVASVSGDYWGGCIGSSFADVYTAGYSNNVIQNCTPTPPPPLADISNTILNNTQPTTAVLTFLNVVRSLRNFYKDTENLALKANNKVTIGKDIDQLYKDILTSFPYLVVAVDADVLLQQLELYRQSIIKNTSNANKGMDLYKDYIAELDLFKIMVTKQKDIAQRALDKLRDKKEQQQYAKK